MNLLLNALWIICLSGCSFAQCPLNTGWVPVSAKCMICGTAPLRYTQAKTACERLGGNLASILTAAEESFAETCTPIIGTPPVWFGLIMMAGPTFGWLDGSPGGIGSSGVAAPGTFVSNCFRIGAGPTWLDDSIDSDCTDPYNYVCSTAQVQCQPLAQPEGSTSIAYEPPETPYYPGNVATYTCATGYELDGEGATRTCEDNGEWSGREPTCDPVECGPLLDPANGRVQQNNRETYNYVATYVCNSGYTLGDVSPSRICQDDKTWSGSALTCSPLDCGAPPSLVNGAVSVSGTTVGSVATYTCDGDYVINVVSTRTCLNTGYWSADQPKCTDEDNTTAIAVGASVGALAFIGLTAAVMYLLCRRTPSAPTLPRPILSPMRPLGPRPLGPRPLGPRPRLY